MKAEIRHFAP